MLAVTASAAAVISGADEPAQAAPPAGEAAADAGGAPSSAADESGARPAAARGARRVVPTRGRRDVLRGACGRAVLFRAELAVSVYAVRAARAAAALDAQGHSVPAAAAIGQHGGALRARGRGRGGAFVFFCAAEAQARVGCHVFLLCGERV